MPQIKNAKDPPPPQKKMIKKNIPDKQMNKLSCRNNFNKNPELDVIQESRLIRRLCGRTLYNHFLQRTSREAVLA